MRDPRGGSPPDGAGIHVMRHVWSDVTFLHWAYPVDAVARLLPPGLEVEAWDGSAWVGLVLLRMQVRPPGAPATWSFATFPETNVRTYVTGPNGETGIWFFSLDAAHVGVVTAARAGWGLPYFWAEMRIDREGPALRYRSRRHAMVLAAARHDVVVEPGPALEGAEVGAFDHYLTARFRLWHRLAGATVETAAAHEPWLLRRATVTRCRQSLLTAAGLAPPVGDPLAHYSPGVDVRIGPPRVVIRRGAGSG